MIIVLMIALMAGNLVAAPKPANSPFSVELKSLTATGYETGISKNLVYWAVTKPTTAAPIYGPSDSAWMTAATPGQKDGAFDLIIPSKYSWDKVSDRFTSVTSYTKITQNRMNSIGDGRFVIKENNYYAVPVISVDLKHQTLDAHLYGLTVTVFGNNQFHPLEDLMPLDGSLDNGKLSGIQLYEDRAWGVTSLDDPDNYDINDVFLEWAGEAADGQLDSTKAHYARGLEFLQDNYPAVNFSDGLQWADNWARVGHFSTLTATNWTSPDMDSTWIPMGWQDGYVQNPVAGTNNWFGWQTYIEFEQPVDIHNINTESKLPFIRFWITARPAACCDNPDGPIDPDDVAFLRSGATGLVGDEFFFSLVEDLFHSTHMDTTYPVFRVINASSYYDSKFLPADWLIGLQVPLKSMMLRPRYYNYAGPIIPVGSEASWMGSTSPANEPALWDVPGLIHGWKAYIGPIATVIDPDVAKNEITATTVDSLKYYAGQKNYAAATSKVDYYPYTTDSLQPIVFAIHDMDNCVNYDSVFMVIDTGAVGFAWNNGYNATGGIDSIGIDSVIFINDMAVGRPRVTPGTTNEINTANRPLSYNDASDGGYIPRTVGVTSDVHSYSKNGRRNVTSKAAVRSFCGLTLIRDTARCIDTLIFNINRCDVDLDFGQVLGTSLDFYDGWQDGQIINARLYAKDLGGNSMYLNYPGPSAPDSSWLADGSTNYSKTVANYCWTRFAVDLSAPIAKMVCPEFVTRPINSDQVIRVVRGEEPEIRIEIKDKLVADSLNAETYVDDVNGESYLADQTDMHPIYVHESEYYPSYHTLTAGMWREIAPGTGVAANNFGILLTLYQTDCTDSVDNRFNPSNFTWDDGDVATAGAGGSVHRPTTGILPWGLPDAQILITDTSSYYGVTMERLNDQNAIMHIMLNDPQFPLAVLADGDVVLVEVVDAKVFEYLRTATTPTVGRLVHASNTGVQIASDGLHDRPNIKWSVYTDNMNLYAVNTHLVTTANHMVYDNVDAAGEELTEAFKFIRGFTQTNFEFAFANPNKHMLRFDETDSDDDGIHDAPEYTERNEYDYWWSHVYCGSSIDATQRLATAAEGYTLQNTTDADDSMQFATDTLGWFYVDQVGPIVDLDGVYPQFRRDASIYDNRQYSNSYTSDPYQVITLDLADLSCITYADSFAAGLDVSSIVVNVKVMSCDGSYHPAYGPYGRNFTPVEANSLYSSPRVWRDACWYINDPTDPTQAMINGITVLDNWDPNTLTSLEPGTRVILDPRLGPVDASNLLGYGTTEPFMRFRDGDKVCVTVFARDVSVGDCDVELGNPIVNDDIAENGTLANEELFKYQFIVDLKEPALAITSNANGCTNRYVDIDLDDTIRDAFETEKCSTWVAGVDSIFVEIQHRDYVEATSTWANPSIIRIGLGVDDFTPTALTAPFKGSADFLAALPGLATHGTLYSAFAADGFSALSDGFAGGNVKYAIIAQAGEYNTYNNGNPNPKYDNMKMRIVFDCISFNDGDSVYVKAWGRDDIDVPWYPIDDDTVYALYPKVLTSLQADQIDHRSQALGSMTLGATRMTMTRRWDQHPNYSNDSTWGYTPVGSIVRADTTYRTFTKGFFFTTNPITYWWTGYDWRNPADNITNSDNVPPSKQFAFGNIHWLWQAPWMNDVLARTENSPNLTLLADMTNLVNNNAWDVNAGSPALNWTGTVVATAVTQNLDDKGAWDPTHLDITSLWGMFTHGTGPVAAGTTRDQNDYDWTDLDSIWVANNVHYNWAKPVSTQFKLLSSSYITSVRDIDPTPCGLYYDNWTWTDGWSQDIILPAKSTRTGVNQYRTGLVDSLGYVFQSCEPFYYCEDVTDTTVGFAMECYDSTGTIKWYWPFFMDSSKYGTGELRANWQSAFNADKSSHNSGSLLTANWKYPVQYGWWDCDCPGCNGILWTVNTSTAENCPAYQAHLKVDLDKLATYTVNGTYQYLSVDQNSTTAYADGDSVVVYTYTRTMGNDAFHAADDHIIRNRYYYLIDQKAPALTFNDLEMYVPSAEVEHYLANDGSVTFTEKGGSLENLEAKYADLVRIKINNVHDVVNTARKSGVGLYGARVDIHNWWGVHETPLQGKVANPWHLDDWYINTIAVQDDPLCRIINGRDTTYFAAIQIADYSIEYREYLDTFYIQIKDKLCNIATLKKPFVVDNIKPKLIWSYCDSTVNKQAFGSTPPVPTFFGYWLNHEAGTSFEFAINDYADSLGIGIYQADDPYAQWYQATSLTLKGHRPEDNKRTAINRVCKGWIYVLVNFNDLMYTGKEDGMTFVTSGAVKIKPESAPARQVDAVKAADRYQIAEKLEFLGGNGALLVKEANGELTTGDAPTVEKITKSLKAMDEERNGWIDEKTWLGEVYIDAATGWSGLAHMTVEGFYDKAGNKLDSDTVSCFFMNLMTVIADVRILNPLEDGIFNTQCVDSLKYMLKSRIKNQTAVDSLIWSYTVKAAYDGTYGTAKTVINSATSLIDNFSTTLVPDSNHKAPFKLYHSGDSITTKTFFNAIQFAPATFATRKDVTIYAKIAGLSVCNTSLEKSMVDVQIDNEKPFVNIVDDSSKRVAGLYKQVRLVSTYFDDPVFYDEAIPAQLAAAKAEIKTVTLSVKDVTSGWSYFTVLYTGFTASEAMTVKLDSLRTRGYIADEANELILKLTVTDDACIENSDSIVIPQVIMMPTVLARGSDLEDAVKSVLQTKFDTLIYPGIKHPQGRKIWPPYCHLITDTNIQVNDTTVVTLDSVQITTFTHYNPADQNPDINDPFGRTFTREIRDYPGDYVYVVAYNINPSYVTTGKELHFIVEGDKSANGLYEPGHFFFPSGENPEWKLTATNTTIGGVSVWYAPMLLEDEDSDQDGLVRITIRIWNTATLSYDPKYVAYTWFLLDTEDPSYAVSYTDAGNVALKTVAAAVNVVNTEPVGSYTESKILANAGDQVFITNGQDIKAFIDVDQTMNDNTKPMSIAARMWKHVNVDFEAPTQENYKKSDESWQIDEGVQVYSNFNSWLACSVAKIYEFKTTIKNGNAANSGFAWVKVEERDAAGNYVRDWSTDKCTGMVVYLDCQAPSAVNADLVAAVPAVGGMLTKTGFGSDDKFSLDAQTDGKVRIFGYKNAVSDDSWPIELAKDATTKEFVPCVKVVFTKPDNAVVDTTIKANEDGTFSVVVDLSKDSTYKLYVVDYAGNESAPVTVTLEELLTVRVDLKTGWNLFSVNVKGGDLADIMKFAANTAAKTNFVYLYTMTRQPANVAVTSEQLAAAIAANQPAGINIGSDSMLAYWIYVNAPVTLTVEGVQVEPDVEIGLAKDWNYVGYPIEQNAKISEAIAQGLDKVSRITNGKWITKVAGSIVETDNLMYVGEGFMIKADTTVTLVFNPEGGTGGYLAKAKPPVMPESEVAISRYFQSFSGKAEIYGKPAFEGDKVEAYDANGIKCGESLVKKDGTFEIMVYGNDRVTEADEGVDLGQEVSFKVIGEDVTFEHAPIFTSNYDLNQLNLSVAKPLPKQFALHQNVPNPFNPSTVIKYDLPKESQVNVVIYNSLGEKVYTLVNGKQEAGTYNLKWNGVSDNGSKVASGAYFYKLQAGDFTSTKQMMLVK